MFIFEQCSTCSSVFNGVYMMEHLIGSTAGFASPVQCGGFRRFSLGLPSVPTPWKSHEREIKEKKQEPSHQIGHFLSG